MDFSFITVDAFAPTGDPWVPVGAIEQVGEDGADFVLTPAGGAPPVRLTVLSPTCLRVRFDPHDGGPRSSGQPGQGASPAPSPAVVARDFAPVPVRMAERTAERLVLQAGFLRIEADLRPFALRIYRGLQLICADQPGRSIVWRPVGHGIANIKVLPENALYCGFGERAGARLLKNGTSVNGFNFDNFIYARAPIPAGEEGGPLNPGEPLYAGIPLLIEVNPAPVGDHDGPPYCYGLFFDNVSQTFFNIGDERYGGQRDRYAFGAAFGALDYYVMIGDTAADVLRQYTRLTGRSAMPPRYAFGFHQGCYGYFDRARLEAVAQGYRAARIPIDGLHIDIDFQDNYRVFTHSEAKFPRAAEMMAGLHAIGFKCSTNVTPLVTDNPLDERGEMTPFRERQDLLGLSGLLYDVRAGRGQEEGADAPVGLFAASISYGANRGVNPYRYPPLVPDRAGVTPLGTTINYPDLGRADVRAAWSRLYAHLLQEVGIDMIWQDMMCPAASVSADTPVGTLPLDLMMHDGHRYVPHAVCHNAYPMFLLEATHDGLAALRPGTRPFILGRGGYAGLQRYAALWTGDNASTWDFLKVNIPQVLNLGLSGVPISGADVGGFATGPIPQCTLSASTVRDGRVEGGITNPELFVRWMQAGSFLPWFRNHYIGYDKEYQEVYAYGEPFRTICRRIIEQRYRMLPLYYDAMHEWTETGMPIARALFLNDPGDPEVYRHLDDQFFVGRDLLVAPVLDPRPEGVEASVREVYLPAGSQWFAFDPGCARIGPPIAGGQTLTVEAGLDVVPVYVRSGAILPLHRHVEQYVGELAENPLDIHLYPGGDGEHLLYQDDGVSTRAATGGAFRTTRIGVRRDEGGATIRLQRLHDGYAPPERACYIRLLGAQRPARVTVGDAELAAAASLGQLDEAPDDAYVWDADAEAVVVKLFDRAADLTVGVRVRS